MPIIFVTAGSDDARRRFRGYEAGAVDFIQKPIEPDVLRSKADVFFELYRQRQQLAAQRDELELQAVALREADRRKDVFLATLAHELRNPLAPLRHGIDVLRRNPDSPDAPEIRERMDRQLGHLVRLIDDLLDVSRVSQGKIELRTEKTTVQDVVRSATEASRPAIDSGDHALVLKVPAEPLWLDADPTRLSQVVGNLLNNAAKYTPAGGRIEIAARTTNDEIVLEVSDNGVGIPADKRADIFELFTQVDAHLHRAQGGLGIGLALVKQLVGMHGGSIEAFDRAPDAGSVFAIRLPLAAAPNLSTGLREDKAEELPARPLRVLVIDDNVDLAYTLELMIEEIGHDVRLAYNGQEGLRQAREYLPDVVLLDIGLPGMDGYEVCRAFRQDPMFSDVAIIAQTGWGQSQDKAKASDAGFDHHLTKPVALEDLEAVLHSLAMRS